MAREKKKAPSRYRLSVPQHDLSVNEWCKMQDNLSFSLRTIIKDYIEANGMTDPTCIEVVETPKVGRPKKGGKLVPVDNRVEIDSEENDNVNIDNNEKVRNNESKSETKEVKANIQKEKPVNKNDDSDDIDEGIDAINRLMNMG